MTKVLYEPGKYRLKLEGHAGATENGVDTICAGASALAWALVEAATNNPDYNATYDIDPDEALIDVQCEPTEAAADSCFYMFEVVLGGLMLIAEAYPEFMEIRIGG